MLLSLISFIYSAIHEVDPLPREAPSEVIIHVTGLLAYIYEMQLVVLPLLPFARIPLPLYTDIQKGVNGAGTAYSRFSVRREVPACGDCKCST